MKLLIYSVMLLVIATGCKKELDECKQPILVEERPAGLSASTVTYTPFRDTLLKYPELVLLNYWGDQSTQSMNCDVYYGTLPLLSGGYGLYRNTNGQVYQSGRMPAGLPFSTLPGVSAEDAAKEARKHINLEYACAKCQLGLYDIGLLTNGPPEYRLVWKVSHAKSAVVFVVLDADNLTVYQLNNYSYVF